MAGVVVVSGVGMGPSEEDGEDGEGFELHVSRV